MKIKVEGKGIWKEKFNSDSRLYWGSGTVFNPSPMVKVVDKKKKIYEINLNLPSIGAIVLH